MSSKRAVITGITGQDGSYLAELLLEQGYAWTGVVRRTSVPNLSRVDHLVDSIDLWPGDLLDQLSLMRLIEDVKTPRILQPCRHVLRAGVLGSAPGDRRVQLAWRDPCLEAILTSILLSGCIRRLRARCMDGFASSQTEETSFYPRSPYGVSKVFAHYIHRELPGELRLVRVLGHPVQSRVAATWPGVRHAQGQRRPLRGSSWVVQIRCRWETWKRVRDWGFAAITCGAMWLMLQQDEPDDYVIATGMSHSVRDLVEEGVLATSSSSGGTTSRRIPACFDQPKSTTWSAMHRRGARSSDGSPPWISRGSSV